MKHTRVGLILISVILLFAVSGFIYTPHDPEKIAVLERFQPPSAGHWLGTDNLGRDVFSRLAVGGRWSLLVGGLGVLVGGSIGTLLGAASGFFGRSIDEILMRGADGMYAFPTILVALLAVTVLGPGSQAVLIAVALGNVPIFMRLARNQILKIKTEPFVEAARAIGASEPRILFRHIIPNAGPVLAVQGAVSLAGAILAEASLSYLGVGIQPPDPSWGRMLREAQSFAGLAPWAILAPGILIAGTVLGFNLIGDHYSQGR
ncbi:MAG TPA: ABC transporter permease [Firmicutes bacterium]|nr:ABC transporter permease [Bacillota bacterium]